MATQGDAPDDTPRLHRELGPIAMAQCIHTATRCVVPTDAQSPARRAAPLLAKPRQRGVRAAAGEPGAARWCACTRSACCDTPRDDGGRSDGRPVPPPPPPLERHLGRQIDVIDIRSPPTPTHHLLVEHRAYACAGTNGTTAGVNVQLLEVLQSVATGVLTADDASVQLSGLVARQGPGAAPPPTALSSAAEFPEVVWGERKSAAQILAALQRIADRQGMAAATRVRPATAAEVLELAPEVQYQEAARMLVLKSATTKQQKLPGSVALICAGTASTTVVEECRLMLASCGCYSFKLAESGVMGMHRSVAVWIGSFVGRCGSEAVWCGGGGAYQEVCRARHGGSRRRPPRPHSPMSYAAATAAGSFRTWMPSRPLTSSFASPVWTAAWPLWWPAWWRCRSSRCPPAPVGGVLFRVAWRGVSGGG